MEVKMEIGKKYRNDQIVDCFKCNAVGGIRISKNTNRIVLCENFIPQIKNGRDQLVDNVLMYSCSEKYVSKILDSVYEIHLFILFRRFQYTYCGVVNIDKDAYVERNDINETQRFYIPLKLTANILEIIKNATEMECMRDDSYKDYDDIRNIIDCYNNLVDRKDRSIFKEFDDIKSIICTRDKELKEALMSDYDELEKCYYSEAYKATLIVAGSILEAFLLDWLSEIDGKNYFEEPFKIEIYDEQRHRYYKKADDRLVTYISAIDKIKTPNWMENAKKADEIRNQRNTVHIKWCLKDDIPIGKETCDIILGYLKEVINSRWEI